MRGKRSLQGRRKAGKQRGGGSVKLSRRHRGRVSFVREVFSIDQLDRGGEETTFFEGGERRGAGRRRKCSTVWAVWFMRKRKNH